jgi:quinol monooxygenase YgiN
MEQPILFVSHWRVQPGGLDRLRQLSGEVAARFRAEKPRTLSWLAYLDDSGTSISFVHVFADAEAMDLHVEGADAGRKAASDLIEPRGYEIYGAPSDSVLDQMRRTADEAGVTLRLEPEFVAGGFLRLAAD